MTAGEVLKSVPQSRAGDLSTFLLPCTLPTRGPAVPLPARLDGRPSLQPSPTSGILAASEPCPFPNGGDPMDPNQTWLDMADAVSRDNWQLAGELAEDLFDWLVRGGFPPRLTGTPDFDRVVARAACEAIRAWECV